MLPGAPMAARPGPRRPQAPLEGSTRPAAAAAQGSRAHQQRRQTGCSRTVPFTELSRLIGKGTIMGAPPVPQQPTPQKREGVLKKKRQGFLTFFFFFFHPPTQHSIKRTKTDILFADLANIKAISIVHRSSPKLVKVVACGSPAKLSFNSYRMPFGDRRGENWLNLDKVRGPLHP